MLSFLKRLLRRKVDTPFDIEKTVGHYLLTLPRCTSRVLVVSRQYQDKCYDYEMTADAASLAAWAKMYETNGWGSQTEKASCKALLLWLRAADLTDNTVTTPPKEFFDIWRRYHETFLETMGSQVYCHECHRIIDTPEIKRTSDSEGGIYVIFSEEWHCSSGHLLFQEKRELTMCSRKNIPNIFADSKEEELTIPAFLRKQNS